MGLSYKEAGVDIGVADSAKREMASALETKNERVLNKVGAFASLVDGRFPGMKFPVLVCKTEEPGTKQKLAFKLGRYESICYDLVNHLINDIIVMGATPVAAQDCIVCGKLEKEVVTTVVRTMAKACAEQGCALTGGETSEQPGVLEAGVYVMTASAIGIVDRELVIDGSKIKEGDVVLALPSNGVHTNGYSLVRRLMDKTPGLAESKVSNETFLDAIMRPHFCYFKALRDIFAHPGLKGLAHITGGGIAGNLNRVLPAGSGAEIDLSKLKVLPIFSAIKKAGSVDDAVMLETFNLGVGITAVVSPDSVDELLAHFKRQDLEAYPIGQIKRGKQSVEFSGKLTWA